MNEHYALIAGSIHRSGIIADKNQIRQGARESMRRLIATDIASNLYKDDPHFDRDRFMKVCGVPV